MMPKLPTSNSQSIRQGAEQGQPSKRDAVPHAISSDGPDTKAAKIPDAPSSTGPFRMLVGSMKSADPALAEFAKPNAPRVISPERSEAGQDQTPPELVGHDMFQAPQSQLSRLLDAVALLKNPKAGPSADALSGETSLDRASIQRSESSVGFDTPLMISAQHPPRETASMGFGDLADRTMAKEITFNAIGLGDKHIPTLNTMGASLVTNAAEAPRLAEQVARALAALQIGDAPAAQASGGRQAITVQLAPHHLGQIALTVRQAGDAIEVRIVAETVSGLAALQSDENALKQVLRTLSVEQVRLDLSLRDDGSSTAPSRNDQGNDQSQTGSRNTASNDGGRERSFPFMSRSSTTTEHDGALSEREGEVLERSSNLV